MKTRRHTSQMRLRSRLSQPLLTLLLLGSLPAWVGGCVGSDPLFDLVPHIEFVDIQPREIREYDTNFYVTIRYKDGDGNLGYEDEYAALRDSADLVMLDNRPEVADLDEYDGRWVYNLPNLTPSGRNLSIQGEITVEFPAVMARLNPLNQEETLTFSIWIYDRDGNRSNTIVTEEVKVIP